MSNIAKAFDHGKALIPFITCGDPSLEQTAEYVRAAVESGADLVELGIPFSDPTAEGAVIMEADARALAAGTTTEKVFDLVRDLRRDIDIPMVFMTYANGIIAVIPDKQVIGKCRLCVADNYACRKATVSGFNITVTVINSDNFQIVKCFHFVTS